MSENKPKPGGFLVKVKQFTEKLKKTKNIQFIVAGVLGIIVIVIFLGYTSSFSSSSNNTKKNTETTGLSSYKTASEYTAYMENRLSNVLSSINGAGKVKTFIVVNASPEIVYAEEKQTTTSGSSVITTTSIVFYKEGSATLPVIIKTVNPKIESILIVASGADNVSVKLNILGAIQALFDINPNKIVILSGE